jgi:hypothetical protein
VAATVVAVPALADRPGCQPSLTAPRRPPSPASPSLPAPGCQPSLTARRWLTLLPAKGCNVNRHGPSAQAGPRAAACHGRPARRWLTLLSAKGCNVNRHSHRPSSVGECARAPGAQPPARPPARRWLTFLSAKGCNVKRHGTGIRPPAMACSSARHRGSGRIVACQTGATRSRLTRVARVGRLAQVVRAARLQRAGRGFESLSAHRPTDVVRVTTLSLLVSYFSCPIAEAGLFRYSNPSPHLAWAVSGDAV